jgi:CheY-specific phosphatase CheX
MESMNPKVIQPLLIRATSDVFKTMVALDIAVDDSQDAGVQFDGTPHYTATIGFAGRWDGSVSIQCSEQLAKELTAKLLMVPAAQIERIEVRDALGETVNMIGGRFKAIFAEMFTEGVEAFRMSIPSVIMGLHFDVFAVGIDSMFSISFETLGERMQVELALKKITNGS